MVQQGPCHPGSSEKGKECARMVTNRGMCHFHWQGELDHMAISNGEKAWSCAQMKLLTKKGVDFNGQVTALEVITQLISPFNLTP